MIPDLTDVVSADAAHNRWSIFLDVSESDLELFGTVSDATKAYRPPLPVVGWSVG